MLTDDRRNTPGILGYALTYVIAVCLVCVGLSLAESDQWFDEYTAGYVFLFAFALLGPVALVGVLPLLHFTVDGFGTSPSTSRSPGWSASGRPGSRGCT